MNGWECSACSFRNHCDLKICEICDLERLCKVSSISSSSSSSSSSSLLISSSAPIKYNRSVTCVEEAASTGGMIELIKNSLTMSKVVFKVAFPSCLHFSQRKSYGSQWSCGYRNIQMMCSSLMKIKEIRQALFCGDGVIPDIAGLQRWIEKAWQDGFDPEGALQFQGKLFGTNKWIGATECAVLLRYFGVDARITDFTSSSKIPEAMVGEKRPCLAGDESQSSMSDRLEGWLRDYFRDSSLPVDSLSPLFFPPLYLQHDGHSRTIVGITLSDKKGEYRVDHVLVFDPACSGELILQNLVPDDSKTNNCRWHRQVKKPIHTFSNKTQYQMVRIASAQPLLFAQRERSKRITSDLITV